MRTLCVLPNLNEIYLCYAHSRYLELRRPPVRIAETHSCVLPVLVGDLQTPSLSRKAPRNEAVCHSEQKHHQPCQLAPEDVMFDSERKDAGDDGWCDAPRRCHPAQPWTGEWISKTRMVSRAPYQCGHRQMCVR